jgi:hypothetical protein
MQITELVQNFDVSKAVNYKPKHRLRVEEYMLKVLRYVQRFLYTPYARFVIGYMNFLELLTHLTSKSRVVDTGWAGDKILVLALWQKDSLRPDIENLVLTAKELGFRVVGVNNKSLSPSFQPQELFDTYIERSNFGRDFGAYREGVLHLQNSGRLNQASNLIILNDSIFYLQQNLKGMLGFLSDENYDFLGATENFEYDHHLGSFALGFSDVILRSPRFLRYWKKYRLTNFRPQVIKRGEMQLSKVCISIARPSKVKPMVGRPELRKFLSNLDDIRQLDYVLSLSPVANKIWKRTPTLAEIAREMIKRQTVTLRETDKETFSRSESSDKDIHFVSNAASLEEYLSLYSGGSESKREITKIMLDEARTLVYSHIVQGSQIHTGSLMFLQLGLPIVKLDLMYRGVADISDLNRLAALIQSDTERQQLLDLLTSRPFGVETLRGWKRAAFESGWI